MPIIRRPSSRSRRPAAPPATLATIFASASHVIRSSADAFVQRICAPSHAACSSNGIVKRSSCRAHGTAAVIFPCSGQSTRGTSDSRKHRLPCTSSVRHRRHVPLDGPAPPPALRAPAPVLPVRLDHHDQDFLIRPVPPRPPLAIRPGHPPL